ncbi:MAG TPA: enoyl-CoA hydratase/isomerase family protein [Alphaproteobacteria bacterium]|nr:enoyl-CoA hydratase/isomerase family protein [Alphaproteobacteria bacterium]MDP6269829.1 enoyl-CoA hydratase/isomerase family protein [Alphaproteobacteria bacterium]MDP7164258.1 enoyl-CoA hydratase/isomerase family protein [Alphaproteobacteria bacterium]MDP7428526.1 enoyl-CoA hydratase/isomerase family protein [Alphaproteobacteria bacterium]HJM49811.1 enoyl-CoA hydratase/isomerase family protein [Alphaproteobacteria bacterium]
MSYANVEIESRGTVAIVRFDRKQNLNAFNQELILELTDVARSFQDDTETRAIVLSGAADGFSAGADLRDAKSWEKLDNDVALRQRFYRGVKLCKAWEELPQITVAAMEKLSVGAGVALALACDWRVLARDAFLYVPEVKIGLNLQWSALPRLITLVGPARAKRIVILCERMGAEQALDWGLVDELSDPGASTEGALALAEAAASMPHATVCMIKEAVNATANALNHVSAYADADLSQLTAGFQDAIQARETFAD